jgi:hypothetical protein
MCIAGRRVKVDQRLNNNNVDQRAEKVTNENGDRIRK